MGKLQDLMRVVDILKGAKDIIATRWVKGNYVRDAKGNGKNMGVWLGIPDQDESDWGYCGDGALRRKIKNELHNWNIRESKAESLLYEAQKAIAGRIEARAPNQISRPNAKIWCFNDLPETTQEIMLEIYDEAIAEQCALVRKKAEEQDGSPGPAS